MSIEQNSLFVDNNSDDDSDDEGKRTIFCANLSEDVTEDLLYELFLQAGPIESVRIPKDPDGKRQKSFGFITYIHKCSAPYAIKLYEGVKLFKRTLTIRSRNCNNNNNRRSFNSNFNTPINNDRNNRFNDNTKLSFNQTNEKLLNVNRLNMEFLENLNSNPYNDGLPIDISSFTNIASSTAKTFLRPSTSNDDRISRRSSTSSSRKHYDKPYQRPDNYNNRHRHYSNRQDRSSNQRRHI